jgi:hypothetical protein
MAKEGPREQRLREMREANSKRKPNPFEDAARGRDPVPVAKPTTKGVMLRASADVGRTAGSTPATGAKPKRGRPRLGEKREPHEPWKAMGISERTYWRRQKDAKKSRKPVTPNVV